MHLLINVFELFLVIETKTALLLPMNTTVKLAFREEMVSLPMTGMTEQYE
jgi:hypothetical protein